MKNEQLNSMSMSKKHVLLVDDEEFVISAEQEMLERYLAVGPMTVQER